MADDVRADRAVIIIGIDPGLSGGVAVLDLSATPPAYHVMAAPVLKVGSRKRLDVRAMVEDIRLYAETSDECLVVIEQVHAFPRQGVVSQFALGYGLGLWEGIVAAFGCRIEKVAPRLWRQMMLAGRQKGKGASIERARELFPKLPLRNSEHGKAEALLLAEYGRRLYGY